jgi:predicted phosphodiesterase
MAARVSKQMQAFREEFPFDFVIMLGDNIYDSATPEDYRRKFELPYKPFLDKGVEFYAVIGNHDEPNQPNYAPFHMGGKRYYTFKAKPPLLARLIDNDVQFFMIDTENVDRPQRDWLEREMSKSDARWKYRCSTVPSTRQDATRCGRLDENEPGADIGRASCALRALGTRALLRTYARAERYHLLHLRRGRLAASARHPRLDHHGHWLRHRLFVHVVGDCGRRSLLPVDQPHGRERGRRRYPPPLVK